MNRSMTVRIPRMPLLALTAAGALIVLGSAAGLSRPAVESKPGRIVSLNLCTDQLLVALADRDQIAGLTRNAPDRDMSAVAEATKGLPILGNAAEQVLALSPDLLVGSPYEGGAAVELLEGRGVPVLRVDNTDSYPEIAASIRQVGDAIGHPGRGKALVARMDAALAGLPKAGRGRVAAYYQRRGYLTGTGTLVDDLMTRVGLLNLATRLGKPPLAQVSLEEMVAARPDFLIVESATDRITDQGTEMLHHPALRDIPRISIPQSWTVCGSPAYVQAARSMAEQLARQP